MASPLCLLWHTPVPCPGCPHLSGGFPDGTSSLWTLFSASRKAHWGALCRLPRPSLQSGPGSVGRKRPLLVDSMMIINCSRTLYSAPSCFFQWFWQLRQEGPSGPGLGDQPVGSPGPLCWQPWAGPGHPVVPGWRRGSSPDQPASTQAVGLVAGAHGATAYSGCSQPATGEQVFLPPVQPDIVRTDNGGDMWDPPWSGKEQGECPNERVLGQGRAQGRRTCWGWNSRHDWA